MKNKTRIALTTLILIASVLGCNLPAADQVPPPEDVQTEAALTVQALLQPTATTTAQEETPAPADNPTSTPTIGPTGTITPTFSVPMLKVLEQTNCRTGPGQDYEVVYTYLPFKELQIIGNYPQENYWLIKSPESPKGVCWLWGEYVEVSGSYWVVSSVTPPPTATIPAPKAPSVSWDYYCSSATGKIDVTLKWSDIADNETGYRVIRNGQVVAELPADSTSFTESIDLVAGEKTSYQVEVYNSSGAMRSSPISFTC
jgi:hypothetical protein